MASLNDYYAGRAKEAPASKRFSGMAIRVLAQIFAAIIFFTVVFLVCRSESDLGYYTRVFMEQGLSMENSWLFGNETLSVNSDALAFTLPVYGVTVKTYAADGNGGYRVSGLSILPGAGKQVKPAAEGLVVAVRGSAGDYSLQINHVGGFATIYKGLSTINVAEGASVKANDVLGVSGEGNIFFSLYLDGEVTDPTPLLKE